MDDSAQTAIAALARRAHVAVVQEGRPFCEAMYDVRVDLTVPSAALLGCTGNRGSERMEELLALIPADDHPRWNRVVVVAVIVQSLLVGADSDEQGSWSAGFAQRLEGLPDEDWPTVIDGVVANDAGGLLTVDVMRQVVDRFAEDVAPATLDACCMALAAAAVGRGDVDEAVRSIARATCPLLVARLPDTRGGSDRDTVRGRYSQTERGSY
ncbi:hypothetical protein [Gordonia phthalatica]|uniref:Uncharacterized protein n=1 Tax=Gordonia phthalatica TaxID=1136941 RepID=A0A0N9MUV0_9ACTN|nr:hypothetical protein [Gordonia phthalatica]ALG86408.1 hypothetical protein ACH46_20310 [Gordonia phthalatica]